jgi:tRNA (guanine37-N1)-methyltransferase
VLLSGDHKKIAEWRWEQAETITRARRPDLFPSGPIRRDNKEES